MSQDSAGFAARLRECREAAGLSQEELAQQSGLSLRTIGNLEQGRTRWPYRDTLQRLADGLGLRDQARTTFIIEAGRRGGRAMPARSGLVTETGPELRAQLTARGDPVVIPRQLPSGVRHFTGRGEQLKALTEAAGHAGAEGSAVVISAIGGTAGVGKTALAVHWAHLVTGRFPDGQLYADLRGLGPSADPFSPADAISRFLDALGVPADQVPLDADARRDLYRSLLAGRRMLIVLDNARDAAQVRPLLPGGPSCMVLVTSRNQLTSLVALEGAHPVSLDVLTDAEGRELLTRRLGAERIAAEPEAASELVELCARLPLALAIAASRAALHPGMSLETLAAGLRDASGRLAALNAGEGADVTAVFGWSYHHLPGPARRMFQLLGIHPGPDISAAAAASLNGGDLAEARQLLHQLAEASLLTEHVPGRFRFHDLLRSYAAERAQAEVSQRRRRAAIHRAMDHYLHSAYAADLLVRLHPVPFAPDPPQPGVAAEQFSDFAQAMAWFDDEKHVLAALVDQAVAVGFGTHGWQLPLMLGAYFDRKGHSASSWELQQAALATARRLEDRLAQTKVHCRLGSTCVSLGAYQDAEYHFRQELRLCEELGDRLGQARAHLGLSGIADHQGRYHDALTHAARTLALCQPEEKAFQAYAMNNLGWCHARLGQYQQALDYCRQAISLQRQVGDRYCEALAWDSLGYTHYHLGRHAEAVSSYERALALFRQVDARTCQAIALDHLGDAHHAAGTSQLAIRAWQQAVAILDEQHRHHAQEVRTKIKA